jgi:hypothetical protein
MSIYIRIQVVGVFWVRGRKNRHRGRKQAAGRRGEPKKLTRGDCGSRKKLAAACRKVSRHATMAWRKRNIFRKFWTKQIVDRGTNWPPAKTWPAVQEWHGAREFFSVNIRPGTTLHREPGEDERRRIHDGRVVQFRELVRSSRSEFAEFWSTTE